MTELGLSLSNYALLGLLYVFLFWAVRTIASEARRLPSQTSGDRLTLETESESPRVFALTKNISIGRLPANDIVLDDTAVSGHHARILRRQGQWWIDDMTSSNGTWLNEKRLNERQRLEDGDRVRVGRTTITVDMAAKK